MAESLSLGFDAGADVRLDTFRLLLVGYAGRDTDAVRAHVDELARHGVPAPDDVPSVWPVPSHLLTQATEVPARATGTSGEAEPVLVVRNGELYVAVGSDHTDRELERTSMDDAKQACAKVISARCWRVADVRDRWDAIELRSSVLVDGDWRDYQRATLAELLEPEWYRDRFGVGSDAVVFCGTVAVVGDLELAADGFRAELVDPAGGDPLTVEYRVSVEVG